MMFGRSATACGLLAAVLGACPMTAAAAAPAAQRSRPPVTPKGAITQLSGRSGCLTDRSSRKADCASVRALRGPGPLLGSQAVAVSRDGRDVYVASASSDAIAVFRRDPRSGTLSQPAGAAGCIAARGAGGCAGAVGLDHPNSVAVSADGRNVYATALGSDSIAIFRRDSKTGALSQATDGSGCLAAIATPQCKGARALSGPDVVAVSADGRNVYVGAFRSSAVLAFARDSSSGALSQLPGTSGCIEAQATDGCASGLALGSPEGLAVSADGRNVYVAAPGSSALDIFARDATTGSLTQATDGTGCMVGSPLAGCTTGRQLGGADAVTVSGDGGSVYVTALLTDSVAGFARAASTGQVAQQSGTTGCAIYVLAVACTLGRTLVGPEGVAVSPDGANVYTASFASGAIDVFDRTSASSALMEKPRDPGCVVGRAVPGCATGRHLLGVSSVALSPDGRNLYATAFASNALDVFKRQVKR
jgi:DNA-binding beta-propeller fold protein YncE